MTGVFELCCAALGCDGGDVAAAGAGGGEVMAGVESAFGAYLEEYILCRRCTETYAVLLQLCETRKQIWSSKLGSTQRGRSGRDVLLGCPEFAIPEKQKADSMASGQPSRCGDSSSYPKALETFSSFLRIQHRRNKSSRCKQETLPNND